MTKKEIYEFIGNLALILYSKNIQISLSSLNSILKDQDKKAKYGNNRGLAKAVSASYRYWKKKKKPVIHHAIAHTFTNKNGKLSWEV